MKEREIEVGERKCEVGLVWKLRRRRRKNGVDKFSVESWRRKLLRLCLAQWNEKTSLIFQLGFFIIWEVASKHVYNRSLN